MKLYKLAPPLIFRTEGNVSNQCAGYLGNMYLTSDEIISETNSILETKRLCKNCPHESPCKEKGGDLWRFTSNLYLCIEDIVLHLIHVRSKSSSKEEVEEKQ